MRALRSTLTARLLDEAIALCKGLNDVLTYAEDPAAPSRAFPAAK